MNEQTPADAAALHEIAAAVELGRSVTNSPEALASRVLAALDAAGFRVSSKPDDDTRREVQVPSDAHPVRYLFGPDELFHGDPMDTAHLADPIAINVTWRGGDRWAVERGHGWSPQMVWDDTAEEFVYEPLPSARSDEFKRRTRYSLAEAFLAARRAAAVLRRGEAR